MIIFKQIASKNKSKLINNKKGQISNWVDIFEYKIEAG
jgi:hypothetical protein